MTRKLDALVHERVFGRPVKWTEKGNLLKADYDPDVDGIDLHIAVFHRAAMEVPDYFSDIATAWQVHKKACSWLFSKRHIYFEALDNIIQKRCRNTEFAPLNPRYKVAWPNAMQFLEIGDFSLAALRAVGVPEAEIQEALDD